VSTSSCDVAIIGSGPSGLAAALQLKHLGVTNIRVIDREETPGGNPRLCHHTGFGSRDLYRLYTGPHYAREYVRRAEKAGIEIYPSTSVTGWADAKTLNLTSPVGATQLQANAILLATGCRERPRSARLIPGTRPQGIFTTGSLQRFVYQYGQPVGRKAVVVGAELISLSTVMTLAHAGIKITRMVTEYPQHQIYFPYSFVKRLVLDWQQRTPLIPRCRVSEIFGRKRVEAIALTHLDSGKTEIIDCDTVVFTGNWIPDHELARLGGLAMNPATRGPQIDSYFRTSAPGIFAAGNVLRGAEPADIAALEGRNAARSIYYFLEQGTWAEQSIPLKVEGAIAWISPNAISFPLNISQPKAFHFRVNQFCRSVEVQIYQGNQLLHHQRFKALQPNQSARLNANWLSTVDPLAGSLQISCGLPE
jgi:NADPH-dependent 2,4-dienoyl-CoA reductase/sulfur reductase-like enzyme